MTSEQAPNQEEPKQQATSTTTNISGDANAPVLSGTFTGSVNVTTNQAPLRLLTPLEHRNRTRMLQKVKTIWVDGLLNNSLAEAVKIELGLATHPDAVELPLNAVVRELHRPPRILPTGTPIIGVFDKMGGTLLILGAPGAGKTTLLLELARDLITRAEADETHPIPVVFILSSWAEKRRPLKEWLVEELNQRYEVPKKVGQAWITQDMVLPLLDGLDEVALEQRSACAEAINTFRLQDGGLLPITVCSRMDDYEALTTRLRLQAAVLVQPVTPEQVGAYLEQAGEKVTGLRTALRADKRLWELLDTPLMLSIAALAYQGRVAAEVQPAGMPEDQQRHLFDAYIDTVFQRRGQEARYSHRQTKHWLSWLAARMVVYNQTVYYIERMQPDWLSLQQHSHYRWSIFLLSGLVGGLVGELVGTVGVGLGIGLGVGLLGAYKRIIVIETIGWSWSRARRGLHGVLGAAVVIGLVIGLMDVLGSVLGGGLVGGLVFGLFGGLVVGLMVGLVGGLWYGGFTVLQHYILRWLLFRSGVFPWNPIPLLDYCVERIFLRRVGGGWIFVHRMLMEHFATLYTESDGKGPSGSA